MAFWNTLESPQGRRAGNISQAAGGVDLRHRNIWGDTDVNTTGKHHSAIAQGLSQSYQELRGVILILGKGGEIKLRYGTSG